MRFLFFTIAIIAYCPVTTGCGSAGDADVEPNTDDTSTPDPSCLAPPCVEIPGEIATHPEWQSQPQITTDPETLMFYGDATSQSSLTEQTITITNKTPYRVMLTRALIVADTRAQRARGDQAYFSVAPLDDQPMLEVGASYQLRVRFNADPQQRTAMLRIETTHPSYNPLIVTLYGKYFTGW